MTIKMIVAPFAALVMGIGSASLAAAQTAEQRHNRRGQTAQRSRGDSSARQQDNGDRGDQNRARQ